MRLIIDKNERIPMSYLTDNKIIGHCGLIFLSLFIWTNCYAEINVDRLADAIGRAENSVKYPYGIKSINTHGDKVLARRICKNTIKHALRDYKGNEAGFIAFLGSRYCPTKGVAKWELKYNVNWVKNVTRLYSKEII